MNLPRLHQPVLLNEVLAELQPQPGDQYLDVTAGGGGHAEAIASIVGEENLTLVDADPLAIADLKQRFKQATCHHGNFADQVSQFQQRGRTFDLILADLGLSSIQLVEGGRGFSFLQDEPLDMRFNPLVGQSLLQLLEQTDSRRLMCVLRDFGQEPCARPIALAIKAQQPQTSGQLAHLVSVIKARRKPPSRIHPATQTFMALRIWVNDELANLGIFLKLAPNLLKSQGRLAIISFHSLEDRLVKQAFRDLADGLYDSSYYLKFKKPVIPQPKDLVALPQARSAKLRLLVRR